MTDTYVANAGGEKLLFLFGDGADPVQYAASCSINTDSKLDISSDVSTGMRANCTDPSAPGKMSRRVKSVDIKFSGSGTADGPSHRVLIEAILAGQPIAGKVIQDLGAAAGYTITGTWVIESASIGGTYKEDQAFDISLSTAGDYVYAAAT